MADEDKAGSFLPVRARMALALGCVEMRDLSGQEYQQPYCWVSTDLTDWTEEEADGAAAV